MMTRRNLSWLTIFQSMVVIAFAEPALIVVDSPLDYQVIQRRVAGSVVEVRGVLPVAADVVEVRLGDRAWQKLGVRGDGALDFEGSIASPAGGWYRLEVRARSGEEIIAEAVVAHVGVGEIFVIAGQSNSANHGAEKQVVKSEMVSTFDGKAWRIAHDPQPGASGGGGSFVPAFADAMVEKFQVPIGIVATGVGATSVREWLPKGARFPNPPTILNKVTELPGGGWESKGDTFSNFVRRAKSLGPNGFRAVLWHQGESDANQRDASRTLAGKLYMDYLTQVIKESRRELGWVFPWFVAQASYHNPGDVGSPDIRAAQRALWDSGMALEGPDSDALVGENRDNGGKGVHFSAVGLKAHGQAWAEKVAPWLQKKSGLKVFILAGQSNMEGQGVVAMDHEQHYNSGKGNLVWSMTNSASKDKMKHLRDADGGWAVRDDVEISFKAKGKLRRGGVTIGYTGYGGESHIGPELQFGHVIGDHFAEPVLLIKTAWGGKSLHKDFRPPRSGGEVGPYYKQMIEEVRAALGDQTYELCGFVWMQGWNDMVSKEATAEYATNLVNLAKDIRAEFDSAGLPFVVGELGNGGPAKEGSGMQLFRVAQKIGTAQIERSVFVPTTDFARPKELSPNMGHGHHWFGNAESYFLVGDALGHAMIEALK
jgi:hypothetical protein